jgi:hypothetical protein
MDTESVRASHFREFAKKSPEEKICFSLSLGYFLYDMLTPGTKKQAQQYRNVSKKRGIRLKK